MGIQIVCLVAASNYNVDVAPNLPVSCQRVRKLIGKLLASTPIPQYGHKKMRGKSFKTQ